MPRNSKNQNLMRQARPLVPKRQTPFFYRANRAVAENRQGPERRSYEKNPAIKKNSKGWRFRSQILLGAMVVLLLLYEIVPLSPDPKIVINNSAAAALHSLATYHTAAEGLFKKSLTNRTKLTINEAAIRKSLLAEFPELSDASIAVPLFGQQPIVYLTLDDFALILHKDNGASIVLGNSGKALVDLKSIPDYKKLHLPAVNDQGDLSITVGQTVLPATSIQFIKTVSQELQAQHFTISGLTLLPNGEELDVNLSGLPYLIKFNLQAEVKQQLGTFAATKLYLNQQHITPHAYMDVRVPGRAYYQ